MLTNAAGAVTDAYEYDAFGNLLDHTGSTPNNYLYRSEQWDPDLGLYYLRARYMNPLTGRFLSRDPEDGDPASPASLHKYSYAEADPVNLGDPSGRSALVQTAQLTITVSVPAVITAVGATTAAILCAYIWEGSTTTAQTQAELTNGHVVSVPCYSMAVPGKPTPPPPPIPFVWVGPMPQPPPQCIGTKRACWGSRNTQINSWKKAEDWVNERYGGQPRVYKPTRLGYRIIDNLTEDNIAQEVKYGRQDLDSDIQSQIDKDVLLMHNEGTGVNSVQWHFFTNAFGGGPGQPLLQELLQSGIEVFVNGVQLY
jgi:RHS repeat-associated protein